MKTEKEINIRVEAYKDLINKDIPKLDGWIIERINIAISNLEWVLK